MVDQEHIPSEHCKQPHKSSEINELKNKISTLKKQLKEKKSFVFSIEALNILYAELNHEQEIVDMLFQQSIAIVLQIIEEDVKYTQLRDISSEKNQTYEKALNDYSIDQSTINELYDEYNIANSNETKQAKLLESLRKNYRKTSERVTELEKQCEISKKVIQYFEQHRQIDLDAINNLNMLLISAEQELEKIDIF